MYIRTAGVTSLDCSLAPKVRFIPAQASGLGFISEHNTRAEGPIHPRGIENSSGFQPSKILFFHSTQAVGLGWYKPHLRC
jgi:hypothetical protein